MKRLLTFMLICALILTVAITGCNPAQPTPPAPPSQQMTKNGQPPQAEATRQDVLGQGKKVVMGFYTDNEGPIPGSKDSMTKHINDMEEVAFFWYSFDGTGKVIPTGKVDMSAKNLVQKNKGKAYALVDNMIGGGFDAGLAHKVLSNSGVRANMVTNLVNLTTKSGWDGISIDIEKTPPGDRNNYSAFIAELAKALKAKDKVLNVSIPAKFIDYPSDLWSGAYDYAAIGKAADQVVLMTYDEHGTGTTQGPIASQAWINRVITFAVGKIPKEKIMMGLPVYAYDWGSDKPTVPAYLAYAQAMDEAKKHGVPVLYDENAGEPHFMYTTGGVRHEVYFENSRSLATKLEYAKNHGLHGVAIWRLGMEDPAMWDNVIKTYGANK